MLTKTIKLKPKTYCHNLGKRRQIRLLIKQEKISFCLIYFLEKSDLSYDTECWSLYTLTVIGDSTIGNDIA